MTLSQRMHDLWETQKLAAKNNLRDWQWELIHQYVALWHLKNRGAR